MGAGQQFFRPDIQGLRAFAVLMVVTYHVWFGRVSGGVDVFLFISAFLMTQQFTRRYDAGKRTRLGEHYLHVFRRLLPAAVLVILSVLLAARLLLPGTRWEAVITQGLASLFYVENFALQAQSVDYYAADHSLASPFQHFWSLSIQGQVFILWPLLLVLLSWAARRYQISFRALCIGLFGLIFAVSLAYSIWYTGAHQTLAYFDTAARLWEFALGSLIALILPYLNPPRWAKITLGWLGIAAMLSCGFLVDVEGAFPGAIALWPILSAAAIMVAGGSDSRFGVDHFLSRKPLQYLGGNSYALYLWHWPILVIALNVTSRSEAGFLLGAAVIASALILAALTTRFVEKPMRSWAWPQRNMLAGAMVTVMLFLVAALPLAVWRQDNHQKQQPTAVTDPTEYPGALALEASATDIQSLEATNSPAPVLPNPERVQNDWFPLQGPCQDGNLPQQGGKEFLASCQSTPAVGVPSKRVLIVGHSHAEQMMAAIEPLAREKNWDLIGTLKGACPFSSVEQTGNEACDTFNEDVRAYIRQIKPDLVITMATQSTPDSADEQLSLGFTQTVQDLAGDGVKVLGIRDNPRSMNNVAECAMTRGEVSEKCILKRSEVLPAIPAYQSVIRQLPTARFIDLSDKICTQDICPPVIGNIRVYLDSNHLTATYVATLAPAFKERFEALGQW